MEIKYWELQDVETGEKRQVKIGACTSVPRLAFTAHWGQMHQAFANLDIPVIKSTGYSWGACLQRAMNQLIEVGCDWIITIDYDSIFSQEDVLKLLTLAARYDEAAAIFPWQIKRGGVDRLLFFLRDENDKPLDFAPANMFQGDLVKAHGGHFGLTLIKVDALKKMPKPWLWEQPNADGEWTEGKEDADIYFWRKFREAGNGIYLANEVRIGHIDEDILWPGEDFSTVRQGMYHFYRDGKPNLAPVQVEPKLKLNLGSGPRPLEGYRNLDIKDGHAAYPLDYYESDLFDEVRASHILEHFPRGQVADVVKEWVRILAPGGRLKIAVPDFDWIVREYSNGHRHDPLIEAYLFGGQSDADDYHKAFFNQDKLKRLLEDAGLVDVRRWQADAKDCSSLAVSLNLEGVKNHGNAEHR
jgi:predicted SAM-dependent methyltransferase